jgi:hypothetical protein
MNVDYGSLISEVGKLISERGKNYGEPLANMQDTADLFNVYLKGRDKVEAVDIPVLMILVKVARLMKTPYHLDSHSDIIGYGGIAKGIAIKERKGGKAK